MKKPIWLILLFVTFSCTNIDESKQKTVSKVDFISDNYQTIIFFVDTSENPWMDALPYMTLVHHEIDSLALLEYLKNRLIQVEKFGESQHIRMGFNVPREFNIEQVNFVISKIQKYIVDFYPEFNGVLELIFRYSTKGNEWLILPPPPE